MDEIKLDVQVRESMGTRRTNQVRRNGFIPAVVYGGSKTPTNIQVERRIFERISRLHHGENVIFHLNVFEKEKKLRDYSAITKAVQYDPVHDNVIHVDFQRISLTEKIEVEVSITTKGEAPGVRQEGGSVEHILWKLPVVCLPTNIPQAIEVDISGMKLNDSVHVKDLVLPEGVTTKQDPEGMVLTIAPPMKEITPEEEAAAAATPELEVIKEKPKEAKEEAPAGGAAKKSEEKAKPEGK